MCANTSQAKGRVERAHLTLQDRLVKELRLREINTHEAANAFAPHFFADFNARFCKAAQTRLRCAPTGACRRGSGADLHLAASAQGVAVAHAAARPCDLPAQGHGGQPDADPPLHRCLQYPDGPIELRADGTTLAYERYDRLPQVDTAAIVENKRLSHALQAALVIQAQRDDRRFGAPSRTNQGQAPRLKKAVPGTKRSSQFTSKDLELAVMKVCSPSKSPTQAIE